MCLAATRHSEHPHCKDLQPASGCSPEWSLCTSYFFTYRTTLQPLPSLLRHHLYSFRQPLQETYQIECTKNALYTVHQHTIHLGFVHTVPHPTLRFMAFQGTCPKTYPSFNSFEATNSQCCIMNWECLPYSELLCCQWWSPSSEIL